MCIRKYWKASEWRAFTLFYGLICLRGILPDKYLTHFMLLSQAIYILLQDNITQIDICNAEICLRTFVSNFAVLYGSKNMTFNIHILLHIPNCVRNWGPLWNYSNYSFENVNGVLLNLFHGTQAVGKQICSSLRTLRNMNNIAIARSINLPSSIHNLMHNLTIGFARMKKCNALSFEQHATLLGLPSIRNLDIFEINLIRAYFMSSNVSLPAYFYYRAIINGQLFHTTGYRPSRVMRRNNYTVLLANGDIVQLCNFCLIHNNNIPQLVAFCILLDCSAIEHVNKHIDCSEQSVKHLLRISSYNHDNRNMRVVDVNSLMRKCIYIDETDASFVCLLPNIKEGD